jgi:SAM-dependent methyltransferase
MSGGEVFACRNPLWRAFTARVVIPWVFAGQTLVGDALELGTGAGANAIALLRRYPELRITATDVDPIMLETARDRLAAFGDRVVVQSADAASLDFDDDAFDAVVSMIMLHHVGNLSGVLGECARVLRAGALMIGYDLTRAGPAALIHRDGHAGHDLATPDELRLVLADTGFGTIHVATGLGGLVARFSARKG